MHCTLFTLNEPDDQLLDGVRKLGIGLQTLLEALVVVLLRTLADVCDGREGRQWNIVSGVKTRFVVALLATYMCIYAEKYMYMYMYMYIHCTLCTCTSAS